MVIRDHDFNTLGILVEHNLGDFRRLQRVDDEGRSVVRPGNDVDLLALQLADDGLDAAAAHADAGTDRIDRGIAADDGDLGAGARIARHRLDLDDAVVDLRHFHLEQLGHELRMGARQEDLRAALLAAHVVDIGAHAVAVLVVLARDQFVAADDRLAAAEVDDHVAVLDALHRAVDDLADAILVFVELAVALGLAHLLDDDLLGRLGGDAAEIHRRQLLGDEVSDLGVGVPVARVAQRNLPGVFVDGLDDLHQPLQLHLARGGIDVGADVGLLAIARARRLLDRIRHRGDDDRLVDRLLAGDRVGDLQKFEPVCTDCHVVVSLASPWPLAASRRSQSSVGVSSSPSGSSPRRFFCS